MLIEEKKSTHKCEVVPLILEKHLGADNLSIANVYGFTCVTNTLQWTGKDRAAYVPADSLVPVDRPEFSFLAPKAKADGTYRIRGMKIRGVLSFGLLVPAPEGVEIGEDVAEKLGVTHYEPPVGGQGRGGSLFASGEVGKAPNVYHVKYDLDAGRRYAKQVFNDGEPVIVTEKIHGANARYVFEDGQMFCGSKTEWKKEYPDYSHVTVEKLLPNLMKNMTDESDAKKRAEEIVAKLQGQTEKKVKNMWWSALDATPALRKFCEANPGVLVYGEVYGAVQDLNYGHDKGRVSFAAFDIMANGRWLNYHEAREMVNKLEVPWVPLIGEMDYNFEKICALAEGKTTVKGANHVREGVVVRPREERYDRQVGRVCLKWVGAGYLEKSVETTEEPVDATGMF